MDHEYESEFKRDSSVSLPRPLLNLESLGLDILLLVADQLYRSVPGSLQDLRFTSQTLNQAITPFRYRRISITPSLVAHPMTLTTRRVWEYIHQFTRHLVFLAPVDWELAVDLLSKCARIQRIDWGEIGKTPDPIPRVIEDAIQTLWSESKVHLISYPWSCRSQPAISFHLTNIREISLRGSCRHSNYEALQNLAVTCKNLESMSLKGMRRKTFSIDGPRLPPIKHLTLTKCEWPYKLENVSLVWDFSRLETLTLNTCKHHDFISSLPKSSFSQLKRFKFSTSINQPIVDTSTVQLGKLLEEAWDLESLDLLCHLESFPLDNLILRWKHLRKLKLHDHDAYYNSFAVCPMVTTPSLQRLKAHSPLLSNLRIDFDSQIHDETEFVESLSGFRNLTKLTLHTRNTFMEEAEPFSDTSFNYDQLRGFVVNLIRKKLGLPFIAISIKFGPYITPTDPPSTIHNRYPRNSPERQITFNWMDGGEQIKISFQACGPRYQEVAFGEPWAPDVAVLSREQFLSCDEWKRWSLSYFNPSL